MKVFPELRQYIKYFGTPTDYYPLVYGRAWDWKYDNSESDASMSVKCTGVLMPSITNSERKNIANNYARNEVSSFKIYGDDETVGDYLGFSVTPFEQCEEISEWISDICGIVLKRELLRNPSLRDTLVHVVFHEAGHFISDVFGIAKNSRYHSFLDKLDESIIAEEIGEKSAEAIFVGQNTGYEASAELLAICLERPCKDMLNTNQLQTECDLCPKVVFDYCAIIRDTVDKKRRCLGES
jgi:hypothetical protein